MKLKTITLIERLNIYHNNFAMIQIDIWIIFTNKTNIPQWKNLTQSIYVLVSPKIPEKVAWRSFIVSGTCSSCNANSVKLYSEGVPNVEEIDKKRISLKR